MICARLLLGKEERYLNLREMTPLNTVYAFIDLVRERLILPLILTLE